MTQEFFNHATSPLRIGRVRLRVRDLGKISDFYQRVLGLTVIEQSPDMITLGNHMMPLLELFGDPLAKPRNPRDAGLFHTAFLLPTRADLAHWLAHVGTLGIKLQGASDHIVSEAVYLADPEGNGIEVYADRAVSHWRDTSGQIRMATEALDMADLRRAATGVWAGFPEGGIIGHVHLQVGDLERADMFYRHVLGFDVASQYPGATFFGSGGYHHHLAGNIWNSRHAGPRPKGAAGLEMVEIIARDPDMRSTILARAKAAGIAANSLSAPVVLSDPWGNAITFRL